MSEKQLEAVTKIAYAMGSLSPEKQNLVTIQTEAFISGMKAQETLMGVEPKAAASTEKK